jgi:Domain of unknown function (DUF1707)
VTRLRTAAGEGGVTLDELADRLDRALTAVTRADPEWSVEGAFLIEVGAQTVPNTLSPASPSPGRM